MKIFAKRKKRSATAPSSAEKRTENKSDPMVEELLEKDPSEWNAKERRLVKRYQKRKGEEGTGAPVATEDGGAENKASEKNAEMHDQTAEEEKPADADNDDESSSDSESSDRDDSSSDSDEEDSAPKQEEVEVEAANNDEKAAVEIEKKDAQPDDNKGQDDKVDKDHEIWSVLDKLNSKQKRTLSRKLDRQGASVLEEVGKEAKKLLGVGEKTSGDKKESSAKDAAEQDSTGQPPAKKRKKGADWSSLTPEERLRREEQRRLQKEAAERRARGEDIKPGHKRPLNSARRRANRRKPKWKKPSSEVKNEHNSSGFMHRKHGGQEYAEAEAY